MGKYYLIRNLTDNLNELWGYQKIKRYDSSYSVMMHFDDDIIKDEIPGNEWEIIGNPTLTTENSKFGKALLLDGRSKLILKNGLTLGGGDFTIDFWAYSSSLVGGYRYCFHFDSSYYSQGSGNGTWRSFIDVTLGDNAGRFACSCMTWGYYNGSQYAQPIRHVALVYEHELSRARMYIDGVVDVEYNVSIPRTTYPYCSIGGLANYDNQYWSGTIEEFRVSDGIARWTDNFTPPTEPYTGDD